MSKNTYNYSGVPNSEEYKQKNFLIVNKPTKGNVTLTKLAICIMATTIVIILIAAILGTYFLTDHIVSAKYQRLQNETSPHPDYGVPSDGSDGVAANQRIAKATVLGPNMLQKEPIKSKKVVNYRLPEHLRPTHYTLQLMPYIIERNFTTDGNVVIEMECLEKSGNVTLNIKDILIDEDSVRICRKESTECTQIEIRGHVYDEDAEHYIILTKEKLNPGANYTVTIHFQSKLNNLLQGFYRSGYLDRVGDLNWMASTQFSPTDARRAFPGFDEPSFKAKFKISLARDRTQHHSLSNMPIRTTQEIQHQPNWVWDHYEETPKMSTYLIAFVVSNLKHSNQLTQNKVNITFWSRPTATNQTFYSSILVPKLLHFLETYFAIPFPLSKMDLVAIPDFGFSAMENWGLVTFREVALLHDPVESMASAKQELAGTIGHELGHQWFGNLVTPKWWDDLWLKEGFATYASYLAVDEVERDWHYMSQFLPNELHTALHLDSYPSTHSISFPVLHPTQIRQVFDTISYKKGASIIRMMSHFLTPTSFQQGLRVFLKKFEYGNARQDDLWQVLQEESTGESILRTADGKSSSVKTIMDTWTLKAGYPLVTVLRNYENGTADITQERFTFFNTNSTSTQLWHIPITYVSQTEPQLNTTKTKFWLSSAKSQIESIPKDGWLLLNLESVGYYRVNYDRDNWQALISNYYQFAEMTRTQLINDALNVARGGYLRYDTAMVMLKQISKDYMGYLPWKAAIRELQFLYDMLAFSKAYGDFQVFAYNLVKGAFSQVSFDEQSTDTDLIKIHRSQILNLACKMQNEECINRAQYLFREWFIHNPDPRANIKANLKHVVYCTAVREGGQREWEFLHEQLQKTNLASEKNVILESLGCSSKQWLLYSYLEQMLDDNSPIRKQDGHIVFGAVADNIYGAEIAMNFLFNNWERINQYYGEGFNRVSKMVSAIGTYLTTQNQLDMVVNFKQKNINKLYATEIAFDNLIEKVTANVEWTRRSYRSLASWLRNFNEQYHLYN